MDEGRATDERPLSEKPPLIRCGETVPDSSNLKVQHKSLC